jgi:hypothetical protein
MYHAQQERSMKKKIATVLLISVLMGVAVMIISTANRDDAMSNISVERCLTLLRRGEALNLHTLGVCQEYIRDGSLRYDTTCSAWYQH